MMTLAMHEMDHIPDDIINCGPPPALWEFVTERSMGEVAQCHVPTISFCSACKDTHATGATEGR